MDLRAILGAVLLVGSAVGSVGCAETPLARRPQAFNCTRTSELGELELANWCGDSRRVEVLAGDSRAAVIVEPTERIDRIRSPMIEVNQMRTRMPVMRPEPFRHAGRPPPPPKR